jgi:hypothetical protein
MTERVLVSSLALEWPDTLRHIWQKEYLITSSQLQMMQVPGQASHWHSHATTSSFTMRLIPWLSTVSSIVGTYRVTLTQSISVSALTKAQETSAFGNFNTQMTPSWIRYQLLSAVSIEQISFKSPSGNLSAFLAPSPSGIFSFKIFISQQS